MELIVDQLDIEKTREHWPATSPFRPALVIPRNKDKRHWLVLTEPLVVGEPPHFSKSEQDEYLRFPVFPYLLNHEVDKALAFMLQLGLSCATHFPGEVSTLRVITGRPVELLYDSDTGAYTGMRYWFGFALLIEGYDG